MTKIHIYQISGCGCKTFICFMLSIDIATRTKITKVIINFLPKNNHTFHRKFFQLFPELIIFASENT